MINFFNEVKDVKPNTEKEKNSKLSRYIEAGLAAGGLGFTAKTVYNAYTRFKTLAPFFEKVDYLKKSGADPASAASSIVDTITNISKNKVNGMVLMFAGDDPDEVATVVERIYYGANDKTPQGILFSLNNFFSSIGFKINMSTNTFIGKIYSRIYTSLSSIIGSSNKGADMPLLHSVSLAILGILIIAIIMILYYIIKFIYKRYKARKAKVRMKEDCDFLSEFSYYPSHILK